MTKKKTEPVATEPVVEEGVEITPEAAQQVLQSRRQERVAAVEKGIQDLCTAYNCTLDVQLVLSLYNQPTGRIVIIPRD